MGRTSKLGHHHHSSLSFSFSLYFYFSLFLSLSLSLCLFLTLSFSLSLFLFLIFTLFLLLSFYFSLTLSFRLTHKLHFTVVCYFYLLDFDRNYHSISYIYVGVLLSRLLQNVLRWNDWTIKNITSRNKHKKSERLFRYNNIFFIVSKWSINMYLDNNCLQIAVDGFNT